LIKSESVPPEFRIITLRDVYAPTPDGEQIKKIVIIDSVSVIKTLGKPTICRETLPKEFALRPTYPNPFNPVTTISYDLPENVFVELTIYDIRGKIIKTLVSGYQDADSYQMTWDGRNQNGELVSSGIYFLKIVSGSYRKTNKMVFIR
jgi:hypothetical protein